MDRTRNHYVLEVYNKTTKKYIATWWGQDFVMAQKMAAKPYNNHKWMGKKRIIHIKMTVEMEIPHLKSLEPYYAHKDKLPTNGPKTHGGKTGNTPSGKGGRRTR